MGNFEKLIGVLIPILEILAPVIVVLALHFQRKTTRDVYKITKELLTKLNVNNNYKDGESFEEFLNTEYSKTSNAECLKIYTESPEEKEFFEKIYAQTWKELKIQNDDIFSSLILKKHLQEKEIRSTDKGFSLNILDKIFVNTLRSLSESTGLLQSSLNVLKGSKSYSEIKRNTIIGLLVTKKLNSDNNSFYYLGLSFVMCLISLKLGFITTHQWVIALPLILMTLLFLNHKALEYRIVHGLYGNTEYEAREILAFIDCYLKPEDFDDQGGIQEVFQSPKAIKKSKDGYINDGVLN